jgi:phosphohistidine phosphatase SixA/CYTH domain-containing protein
VKRILLARHAQARSAAPGESDHDRTLSEQGEQSARRLGSFLSQVGEAPQRILASSAERARSTARLAAEAGGWSCPVETTRQLYSSSPDSVHDQVIQQDDEADRLLVVGHEPTCSELASRFLGGGHLALAPATLVCLDFGASRWSQVALGSGSLAWMLPMRLLQRAEGAATPAPLLPDGASLEIERKFLLRGLPEMGEATECIEIDQGWLPGQRLRERIRRVRSDQGETYLRTLKLGQGVQRLEIEEPTPAPLFEQLWPLTEGCRIRKRRYRVREGDLLWEIDAFADRDLVLAEVELDSASQRPAFPAWLADYVLREVTDDPRFTNLALAEAGGVPGD